MSAQFEIIGNESEIIYYNLNKQFVNINKVLITSNFVLDSFEDDKIKNLLVKLKTTDPLKYKDVLDEEFDNHAFEADLNNDFYQLVMEKITKTSQNAMDIQLKDYSFMSSVSNTKFNIVLRCDNFSISRHYQEKGAILSSIKSLIKDYLKFSANKFRLSRLNSFQFEIYEAEDVYKQVFLKKEGDNLILSSTFGFMESSPIDFNTGSELYISKGTDFKFFENNQTHAIFRDHAKIAETEIHKQPKILSEENLVLINNNTKNINDAIIELYLTKKEVVRIVNISLLESSINHGNENGILINKSNKSYDRVSLIGLRDNFDEELPNPKYLTIRNSSEVKELLNNIDILETMDGIVFNENFYHPLFDALGQRFDLDIIYYKFPLNKALEISLDTKNIKIGDDTSQAQSVQSPFSNIIDDTKKEKDEMLERLKSIDLTTPKPQGNPVHDAEKEAIQNATNQIIGSANSSFNSGTSRESGVGWGETPKLGGAKKSAIGMLADAALNQFNEPTPVKEEPVSSTVEQIVPQTTQPPVVEQKTLETYGEEPKQDSASHFSNSTFIEKDATSSDVKPLDFSGFANAVEQTPQIEQSTSQSSFSESVQNTTPTDNGKYENIIGAKILTKPNVNSGSYFAGAEDLGSVTSGEIFYLSQTKDNLNNPHMKYVLPIGLYSNEVKGHYFIVNDLDDFFHLDQNSDIKIFVNISKLEPNMKKSFFEKCLGNRNSISVILMKNDLDIISDYINKIDNIFIKDVASDEELEFIKQRILGYEKRFLMRS